ncbi:MAG: methylated-DNA--[protein]-cysteine S-methyltransferase [Chitinophagales bacterium]|nr:methylated-DNA--[protein]-cysteine S-methyltransferase [Chitinophagales bacterium]
MKEQEDINYQRIAEAIRFIQANFKRQPSLDEIAKSVHLSPFHFQRLFAEWAGISPKSFLQYTSLQHAKKLLASSNNNLLRTAEETGLSSSSRLHELFIKIEGMTPGEYKNEGANLELNYHFETSPFGQLLLASSKKGLCHMIFCENQEKSLEELKARFPQAKWNSKKDAYQEAAMKIFTKDWSKLNEIKLHLKGSEFQIKVWETLLKIPLGRLSTYGEIAQAIQNPKAARAVGTAIGSNPIAFLIPCHRVIQASGALGGYMWGPVRKTAILAWEAGQIEPSQITKE